LCAGHQLLVKVGHEIFLSTFQELGVAFQPGDDTRIGLLGSDLPDMLGFECHVSPMGLFGCAEGPEVLCLSVNTTPGLEPIFIEGNPNRPFAP
jgi:hypothetical protein